MNLTFLAETGFVAWLKKGFFFLYQLILGLGGPGLFFLALADSSFVSIPEGNDILIVVLSIGQSFQRMLYLVAMTTAGSVCGCSLLYWVGRRGGKFVERRMRGERVGSIRELYRRWGGLAIVIPSMLPPPMPFKVFVLSAGVFGVTFGRFLLAVLLGRSMRYFAWGFLAWMYGTWAKTFMEDNVRLVGIVASVVIVTVMGLALVLRRWRKGQPQGGTA